MLLQNENYVLESRELGYDFKFFGGHFAKTIQSGGMNSTLYLDILYFDETSVCRRLQDNNTRSNWRTS